MSSGVYTVGERRRRLSLARTSPLCPYWVIRRAICARLNRSSSPYTPRCLACRPGSIPIIVLLDRQSPGMTDLRFRLIRYAKHPFLQARLVCGCFDLWWSIKLRIPAGGHEGYENAGVPTGGDEVRTCATGTPLATGRANATTVTPAAARISKRASWP
jgi:hypothetical protein